MGALEAMLNEGTTSTLRPFALAIRGALKGGESSVYQSLDQSLREEEGS